MSDLPTGEAIALGFALALSLVVFAGLCVAAWLMANDEGDVE